MNKNIYAKFLISALCIACTSLPLHAQNDCCDTGGDKVQTFTFEYTGQNCGASNNNQGNQGDKWDCDNLSGGPSGDNSVYIISSKEDDGGGDIYFSGTIAIGETFTASSLQANDDDFPSRTYHLIYSSQGGNLLQVIEVHASCSAPVVVGDQFGSLILRNATFKNGYTCGPSSPPNNPNCSCQSGIYTVTFTYNGPSGIGGGAYDYHDNELGYWSNLVAGQSYTFNISNTNHDHWHEHNDPIFWTYQNGWINHGTMDSSCDSDVLGNSYGPFTITGWVDLQGNQCTDECDNVTDGGTISGNETNCGPFDPAIISNVEEASGNSNPSGNTNVGNNNGSNCCLDTHSDGAGGHNHVKSLNLLYTGPTGNVNLYTNDGSGGTGTTDITQFVATGTSVIFEAAGNQKYGSNADFTYPGGTVDIHTSCSQDDVVLGATFGPFQILGIETANGCSEGEFGPPPPPPSDPIEYQWIQSTTGCPDNISQAIPGATGATYNPPFITQTTWYVRLAKRELCEENEIGSPEGWVASNCIIKTVEEDICACLGQNDTDNDGVCDPDDNCIFNPNPNQEDNDGDGIGNLCDNCPNNFNPNQTDFDGDGIGDACDTVDPCFGTGDSDGDGICNPEDNCVSTFNPNQVDNDGDGVGNVCDNCPSTFNPNQVDSDGDGIGDACESGDPCSVNVGPCSITISGLSASEYAKIFDANWNVLWECNPWGGGTCNGIEIINLTANGSYWIQACGETNPYSVSGCGTDPCAGLGDSDGDGVCNPQDNCPFTSNPNQADNDNDGIGNVCDNCPNTYNPNQADSDGDGIGNACESVDPCNNYTYGGEIGFTSNCFGSYILCDEPVPTLTNCASPSGGSGTLEVVWLKSVGNPNCNMPSQPISNIQNDPYWSVIPGETSLSLNNPGFITEKTCFLRCVRRAGCENYIESNVIAATLDPNCGDNNVGTCEDITVIENNGAFYLSNYNYPIVFVKVYTSTWTPVYNSEMLTNNSSHTTEVLTPGSYIVSIQTFDASWNTACNELYYLNITGGNNNPCDNSGGDSDNDNICNYQDNCPYVYNPDQADNDNDGEGNPCDDTPDGEPGNDCDDIIVSVQNGAFYIDGYNAPIVFIKVYDSGWAPLYNSDMLSNSQSHTTDFFGNGSYIVHVQTFDASWNTMCNELYYKNIGGGAFYAVGEQIFDFQAMGNAREVNLIWMTNTESINDYFVIEHSTNGLEFTTISEVASSRSSNGAFNYTDQDEQPKFGDNFYRIKKVHTDGTIQYSAIRKVFFDVELSETAVFPNPAEDEVFVNLSAFAGKRIIMSVINQYGQLMDIREFEEMGTEVERFDISKYPSGTYIFYIDIDGRKNFARRFIKSRL